MQIITLLGNPITLALSPIATYSNSWQVLAGLGTWWVSVGGLRNLWMTYGWVAYLANPAHNPAGRAKHRPKSAPARPDNKPTGYTE